MSEGTAREIVARAFHDGRNAYFVDRFGAKDRVSWDEVNSSWKAAFLAGADAVLAALQQAGALAPAGLTAADLDAAQRDVAEALRMATQAGIGFEQGMPNARRLAADADRKATEAFRTLRALAAPAADAAPGEPS